MNEKYDHKKIEKKWQDKWEEEKVYSSKEDPEKPKAYVLDMFPYPSGEGLHVGHPKGYIATDVYSRYKRMTGHSVLHPMGWDAFGLPAENFAIKNKVHPRVAVEKNIARYKEQLSNIGLDYDWAREINTTDPEFYKWSQWIFLKLYEKGLAFESYEPINWCPSCQTGLANEDLEDGKCERCGSEVERRPMRQWVLKITDYADRLLEDIEILPDWPEHIKEMQWNWIGRSEGATIQFPISNFQFPIEVFTTRPDTLFGATYLVLAPEHRGISNLKSEISNWNEVENYIKKAQNKSEIERTTEGKEKTGVELKGIKALNPVTNEEVAVWVADYVLGNYGTGAIMAVPAHDERDFEFAEKFKLPVKRVIKPANIFPPTPMTPLGAAAGVLGIRERDVSVGDCWTGEGVVINSGKFNGLTSEEAREKITKEAGGQKKIVYRLQDWVFSRQRYWGEPIPIIHCEKCGAVPVPEKDLPVVLPEVESYEPTGTGESPLANITEWVNVTCPSCEGPGKRETNTMPQWAGSSWYYLRFMDPGNGEALVDPLKEKYWSPVDVYVGGAEHATRHLIYARFWHKFLFDIGVVSTKEPFMELHSVGLIQAEDGRKMSKRYGNVINPDDIVDRLGADSLRIYEMFMGPFENSIAWSSDGIVGARRFIERVWGMQNKLSNEGVGELDSELHKTIKKVGSDILDFKFNTAISQMMIFANAVEKEGKIGKDQLVHFLKLLAPFAPHITEELWHSLGNARSIHLEAWPEYDEGKLVSETVRYAIQVNGKVRGILDVATGASQEEVVRQAAALPAIEKWMSGNESKKTVFVEDRLVNFVV